MFRKRFSRALAFTVISSLVMASATLADGINADGDNIAASGNIMYDATHRLCSTRGSAVAGDVLFSRNQGTGNHFAAGSEVTVSAVPNAAATTQGITVSGGNTTIPSDGSYAENGDTYNAVGVLSTTVPTTAASGTYTIDVSATGPDDSPPGTITRVSSYNVIIDCPASNTAPVIAFTTTAPTTADEGDTKTYNFSITDAPADTHTFVTGYPDCGTGNTLVSSSIDDLANTGTFDCLFPDGLVPAQASNVKVKVQDSGTPSLESNELTANTTVSNVDPTVVAGFGTSADCQTAATLNVDPDDLGVNDDDWKVNISWGDGNNEPEITRDNLNSFNVTHVYALAGAYNATVTVEDKDGGTGSDADNSITVNQTYTLDFLAPFDDSTPIGLIVNRMKNGRVVPVKATIFDDCGLAPLTDPDANVTIRVSKTSGTSGTADPVEEYADAGASSAGTNEFRWADGFWIYNLDSKALGLVVNNYYRVDIYVGAVKATVDNWAVLQPVK